MSRASETGRPGSRCPSAIASPMFVPSSPARAGRMAAACSTSHAWSGVGGQTSEGEIGEGDQADQVVRASLDELPEGRLGRLQPRDHPRAAVRGEVRRLHARAMVQRHDDRHPLPVDPRLCRRRSAAAPAPPPARRSPGRAASGGSHRSQTHPGRVRGANPAKLGQPIRGRHRSSSQGIGTRIINQNQPGLANCILICPLSVLVRCPSWPSVAAILVGALTPMLSRTTGPCMGKFGRAVHVRAGEETCAARDGQ